jgi:hypothetical protein
MCFKYPNADISAYLDLRLSRGNPRNSLLFLTGTGKGRGGQPKYLPLHCIIRKESNLKKVNIQNIYTNNLN